MSADVNVRVPNLPIGPITDKDGNATASEQIFRQALIDLLNLYLGPEGIVMPPQPPTAVTTISTAVDGITGQATMLPGTIIYEQDPANFNNDRLVVAFRSSNTTGAVPTVKTITVV